MSISESKDLEFEFTLAFLRSIGNASLSNLKDDEKPDFILYESEFIGIEVTQLFSDSDNGEISRKRIEGGWDDVLELTLKLWTASGKPSVDVRIQFNELFHIPKSKKVAFSKELLTFIDLCLPEQGQTFFASDGLMAFPGGIVELNIYRYPEIEISTWRCEDACWPLHLTSDLIQKRITIKEELRKIYLQKCDKIWLLIVLYGRRPSGRFIIPQILENKGYSFEFDKVFLFDAFPPKCWELRRTEVKT